MNKADSYALKHFALEIRIALLEELKARGFGHIGGSLSVCDLLAVLYGKVMNYRVDDPQWADRDKLVCSKGHAGPAVYATLSNRGYFDKAELLTLNQGGTHLPSHCDMNLTRGIDMTTGSLGQGFSCAVGVALGSKLERDGATIYTLIGDGESQEGQIWEAAMFAAAKKLSNLIAFTDYNKLQIDDTVAKVNDIAPLADKWRAFGWNVIEVADGNDAGQVSAAVKLAKSCRGGEKPTMVILNTVKGCGVKWIEELGSGNHNCNISAEQAEAAIREIRGED